MTPAQILYRNLFDDAVITASSQIASAPPSRLQDHHVGRRWCGNNGDTEYINCTWSTPQLVDCVAAYGWQGVYPGDDQLNLTEDAITRVRVSSTGDPTLGDLFDSGSAAGRITEANAALVVLVPAPVMALSWRIDVSQAGVNRILGGRGVTGLRNAYRYNFSYNWSEGYGDNSRRKKSAAGQTFVDRDDTYRIINVDFGSLDEADKNGFVREMKRINGMSRDFLFITNPESTDITTDSIWGLLQDLSLWSQPNFAFFQDSLNIEERK